MMGIKMERRVFPVEVRVKRDDDGKPQIVGHAAVFDSLSEDLGGFREKIAPGAFKRALKEKQDVRALFNHDPNVVLGRTKNGTLKLKEDDDGLLSEIDPPDTQMARDLVVSMERGDVDQMSFGFVTKKDQWEETDDGDIRTLLDVDLYDVSPVTFPAYPDTDVAVRSHEQWRKNGALSETTANVYVDGRLMAEIVQKEIGRLKGETQNEEAPPIGARLLKEKVEAAAPK